MFAKRHFTIATAVLGLTAASAVYAGDDSRWLREQLSLSDGAPRQITHEPSLTGPEGRPASTSEQTAESRWVLQQRSLTDGGYMWVGGQSGPRGPEGRPAASTTEFTAQDAFFERQRHLSDGYQP
jgi:hypothetical protein